MRIKSIQSSDRIVFSEGSGLECYESSGSYGDLGGIVKVNCRSNDTKLTKYNFPFKVDFTTTLHPPEEQFNSCIMIRSGNFSFQNTLKCLKINTFSISKFWLKSTLLSRVLAGLFYSFLLNIDSQNYCICLLNLTTNRLIIYFAMND